MKKQSSNDLSSEAIQEKKLIYSATISTPLGEMFAFSLEEGICLVEFTDRKNLDMEINQLKKQLNAVIIEGQNKHLEILHQQLNEFFEGKRKDFSVSLITIGTEFQRKTWNQLQDIPFGATCSYKEQSNNLGSPGAIRAVAHANALNKIAIVIPCHRVIGGNGSLTGYSGGLWRKKWLLEFEKSLN